MAPSTLPRGRLAGSLLLLLLAVLVLAIAGAPRAGEALAARARRVVAPSPAQRTWRDPASTSLRARAGAARTLLDAGAPSLQDWVDSVTQDALKRAGTQGVTIGGGGAPAYRASSALPTQQQQQQQGAAADDDEEALPLDSTTTTTTQQAPSSSSSSASPARMPTVASAARTPSTGGQASGKISGERCCCAQPRCMSQGAARTRQGPSRRLSLAAVQISNARCARTAADAHAQLHTDDAHRCAQATTPCS